MDFPPKELSNLADQVADLLKRHGKTVCLAETACGGLISSTLLSRPGASRWYRGGLTLYTLESRIAYAGWTEDDVKAYRGPTTSITAGLARHIRGTLKADYALGESGTAGPTGGKTPNRRP